MASIGSHFTLIYKFTNFTVPVWESVSEEVSREAVSEGIPREAAEIIFKLGGQIKAWSSWRCFF
jgi:hypothetical protein